MANAPREDGPANPYTPIPVTGRTGPQPSY